VERHQNGWGDEIGDSRIHRLSSKRVMPMSIVLSPDRLRLEMARRGWSGSDLARASRLSPPTISAALAGRPVAAKTLASIARALCSAPTVEGVDGLVVAP
jgi:hypothetical protein